MNKAQQRKKMARAANLLVKAMFDFHRTCGIKDGVHGTSITTRSVNSKVDYTIMIDNLIMFSHSHLDVEPGDGD